MGIADIEVRDAGRKGKGVFATRRFRPREFIFRRRYGRAVKNADLASLSDDERRHLCELDYDTSAVLLPPGCYLNHSCDPNAMRSGVKVFAWRDIAPGEEITIEYRLNAFGGERWPCACGSANCTGEITGDFFSMDVERQRAYLPYAPAFIRQEYRRRAKIDVQPGLPISARIGRAGSAGVSAREPDRVPERCWLDSRVIVERSSIEGLGLFATSPIRSGEVVGVLGGEIIDDNRLQQVALSGTKYNSAAVGEGVNVLLRNDELIARGNHSCDSNLWMRDAFTLEARRDIAVREEITVDYALMTAVDWSMQCTCGSALCRKVVTGADWTRSELQERYRGHFSPFLNKRIHRRRGR